MQRGETAASRRRAVRRGSSAPRRSRRDVGVAPATWREPGATFTGARTSQFQQRPVGGVQHP